MAKRKPSAYNRHVGKEMRAGKTMKQAAASWNKKTGKPKKSASKSKGKGSRSKGRRNVSRGKMFGNISGIGALEDLGVGLVGGVFFRAVLGQRENAIPATRIMQGLAGHAMNRRGKRHLVDGLIDYIDNLLLNMIGMGVAGARPTNGLLGLKLPFRNL